MASPSLTHSSQHYTIKEFQLLVKDAPVVPAEIQPFVGVQFCSSLEVYRLFKGLAEIPVETDLPPGTSPLSKLDLGPFEVHSMV